MGTALLVALAGVIMTALLNELTAWSTRLAECLLRWGARTFGIPDKTSRYEEEWLGNLRHVPGQLSKLWLAGEIILRAVPEMRRDFSRAADGLVAACRADSVDARELAERYKKLQDSGGQSRPGRRLAALLMKAAVESLSAERAVDLARQLRDLGLEGTAIGFTSEWLRLERICYRQPEDAVALVRVLTKDQPDAYQEFVEERIRDATSQWSRESKQRLQQLLRRVR